MSMIKFEERGVRSLIIALLVLAYLPALLIHLGLMPLIEDEAIRALVALEMMLSGDFLTPTLSGEFYFKKPPLYNWIVAGFFALFGKSDFVFRLPVVVTLIVFVVSIVQQTKREIGFVAALLAGLFFLSAGRILFYESFHGLIDLLFSLLIFYNFIILFRYSEKNDLRKLFLFSYLLMAFAFLLKGLPTVVFQGLSLFALFLWRKQLKNLFKLNHFIGIGLFCLIVGSYYTLYLLQNPGTLSDLFSTLLTESTRRTPVRFGWLDSILHIFTFPFETIGHFLPWALLAVLFFFKQSRKLIKENRFVQYLILMISVNIIVYWISPEVYPRYILMLIALLFVVLAYLFVETIKTNKQFFTTVNWISSTLIFVLVLLPFAVLFTDEFDYLKNKTLLVVGLAIVNAVVFSFWWKHRQLSIFFLVIFMGISRIGFDFFILTHRHAKESSRTQRDHAITLAQKTRGSNLNVFWPTTKEPLDYVGKRIMQIAPTFYYTRERNEILRLVPETDTSSFYLGHYKDFGPYPHKIHDTLMLREKNEVLMFKFRSK